EKKRRRLRIAIDLVADRRAIAADFVRHALCLEENGLGLSLQHDVEFVAALARTTGHERMAAFGWHEREDRIDFIEWFSFEVHAGPAARRHSARHDADEDVRSLCLALRAGHSAGL